MLKRTRKYFILNATHFNGLENRFEHLMSGQHPFLGLFDLAVHWCMRCCPCPHFGLFGFCHILVWYIVVGLVNDDEKTTKKRQSFCNKSSFSSFCSRFRRFVVVFFFFISFRRLSRLLRVWNDRFFAVFMSFLTSYFFQTKSSFFDRFFVVFFCRFLRRFFQKNSLCLIVFFVV